MAASDSGHGAFELPIPQSRAGCNELPADAQQWRAWPASSGGQPSWRPTDPCWSAANACLTNWWGFGQLDYRAQLVGSFAGWLAALGIANNCPIRVDPDGSCLPRPNDSCLAPKS